MRKTKNHHRSLKEALLTPVGPDIKAQPYQQHCAGLRINPTKMIVLPLISANLQE